MIQATEDWIILRGTNTQIYIEVFIKPDKVEELGSCCVDSLVTTLLPTFDEGKYEGSNLTNPVKFSLSDSKLSVSQGRRRHQPTYMSPEEFPKKPQLNDYQIISHQDKIKLISALQRLGVSISTTDDRKILQGFHLNPHLSHAISGDGTRTTLVENLTIPGNITTIPARLILPILPNLNSLSENDKLEVKLSSNLSGFKAEQYVQENLVSKWEIIVNGLDGEFPPKPMTIIKDSLTAEAKLKMVVEKEKLSRILEVAKVYSDRAYDEGSTYIYLIINKTPDEVLLQMNVPNLVNMDEPLDCDATGEENFKYMLHPGMVLEELNEIKTEKVELRFFGPLLPFLILDGSDFIYLQAPMVET